MSVDEGCSGLVLVETATDRVVGYAVYNEGNREVIDIAVEPEMRQAPGASRALFEALTARISDIGGTWRATARESTSLASLRAAATRGIIRLSEIKTTDNMGNDPMVEVEFTVA